MATNEKFTRELVIVENVNSNIENHIVTLKKLQVKALWYNKRNIAEISEALSKVPGADIKDIIISICKH